MPNSHLYLAASVACITACFFGYSVGFIGGLLVLPSFARHFSLDTLPPSATASIQSTLVLGWLVGGAFGVPLGIPVCQRWGRKACLNLSAGFYVFGALLQVLELGGGEEGGLVDFEVGRFFNGLGVGIGTLVTPLYISEISTPSLRGVLMGGFQVIIQVSALLGFWCSFFTNALIPSTLDLQWRIPCVIQLIPGLALLILTLFIPETPRFFAEHGHWEKAEDAIAWLRGVPVDDVVVEQELEEIQETIRASQRLQHLHPESFWTQISKKGMRNRLGVGIGIMIAQNMTGLNALNFFSPVIFMSAGFTSVSQSLLLTGIYGVVKLIAAFVFMFYCIKTRSNRFWLQFGALGCAISMGVLSICVRSFENSDEQPGITARGVIAVLMVYIFTASFQISLGPISWVICGEIFPLHLNTLCCAITTLTQWIFSAGVAASTPFLLEWSGWKTYGIYQCCCVAVFVWVHFVVPETRDVPLGRPMDRLFGVEKRECGVDETAALLRNEQMRKPSVASFT